MFAYAENLASTLLSKAYAVEVSQTKFITGDNKITKAAAEIGVEAVKLFNYLGVKIYLLAETVKAVIKRCDKFSNASVAQIKTQTAVDKKELQSKSEQ